MNHNKWMAIVVYIVAVGLFIGCATSNNRSPASDSNSYSCDSERGKFMVRCNRF